MESVVDKGAERRSELSVAVKLCGGVSDVADQANVDRTNLTRWLAGKPTLSQDRVERVLETIGLVGGRPRSDRVHDWRITHGFADLGPGLRIYFSTGAKLRVAPWTIPGRQWAKIINKKNRLPEVFAISDGRVRAVLRAPSGVFGAVEKAMGQLLELANPTLEESFLDIGEGDTSWLVPGTLTVQDFDTKFQMSRVWTLQDVGDLLTSKGVSLKDAFGRISKW